MKARFDADGDGRTAPRELLGADILALARRIVVRPPIPPPPIGDDAELRSRLAELRAAITKELAFTEDEVNLPAVQLAHTDLRKIRAHAREWLVPAAAEKIVRHVDRVLVIVG